MPLFRRHSAITPAASAHRKTIRRPSLQRVIELENLEVKTSYSHRTYANRDNVERLLSGDVTLGLMEEELRVCVREFTPSRDAKTWGKCKDGQSSG